MKDGGARAYGRSAALLTSALGLAGVLVYVFFACASHALTSEDYGRIVVLWSAMFLGVSILFRPVELMLARSLAHAKASRADSRGEVGVAARIQLGVTVAFLVAAVTLRRPIEEGLFDGEELLYWAFVASVAGFAAVYWLRGYLAGSGRFGLYSLLLLSDGACRGIFAVLVALAATGGADLAALGIAIPPALSAAVTFVALRGTPKPEAPASDIEQSSEFTLVEGGGLAASVLLVMAAEQVFLNSGPLIALARDSTESAGFIFNVLMVVRAPALLFQATTSSLLPHLTSLRATTGKAAERAFRTTVRHTLTGVTIFAAVTAAAILLAGPSLMQLAFGDEFDYDRTGLLIVALGMWLYLVATTQYQVALARRRAMSAAACWVIAAVALIGWLLLADLDVERLIQIGLAGSAALLCALLTRVAWKPDG
jgi:O-antigen/teichoic acid export membrane protein